MKVCAIHVFNVHRKISEETVFITLEKEKNGNELRRDTEKVVGLS